MLKLQVQISYSPVLFMVCDCSNLWLQEADTQLLKKSQAWHEARLQVEIHWSSAAWQNEVSILIASIQYHTILQLIHLHPCYFLVSFRFQTSWAAMSWESSPELPFRLRSHWLSLLTLCLMCSPTHCPWPKGCWACSRRTDKSTIQIHSLDEVTWPCRVIFGDS